MPYDFHKDPRAKWDQQYLVTKNHILPFIEEHVSLNAGSKVLDIGCGEGGVLKAFLERGIIGVGIDISASRIENAKKLFSEEIAEDKVSFFAGDIHDTRPIQHLLHDIDLIILKDAIEHIFEREKMLRALHKFIKNGGVVFFAFPPWFNPFGGHQQLAESALRYVPWFHLFPRGIYQKILRACGESAVKIDSLLKIYDTRLPTKRFETLLQTTHWQIKIRRFYFLNPIYEYKFGIKGRKQLFAIAALPVVRDVVSTGVYYIVQEA